MMTISAMSNCTSKISRRLRYASSSASYVSAQFRMEFGSNRSDDVCGTVLGEAADQKHLISQCQAGCDVLWKYDTGSRPCKRYLDHRLRLQWRIQLDCARVHSEEYVQPHGVDQTLQRRFPHGRRRRLPEPFSGQRPRRPPCVPTFLPCESVSGRIRPQ